MRLIDLSQPLYDNAPRLPGARRRCRFAARQTVPRMAGGWRRSPWRPAPAVTLMRRCREIAGGKDHLRSARRRRLSARRGSSTFAGLPRRLRSLLRCSPAKLPGPIAGEIVLLATSGWGERRAKTDKWLYRSPFVDPSGARWLVERGVRGVGIDHYSIGGSGALNAETHTILLGSGLWVVELKCPRKYLPCQPR